MLSFAQDRRDVQLFVNGVLQTQSLEYTPPSAGLQWADHTMTWAGTLGAGSHTIALVAGFQQTTPVQYGCQGTWGNITTVIFE
jgi:hypothetical protein